MLIIMDEGHGKNDEDYANVDDDRLGTRQADKDYV